MFDASARRAVSGSQIMLCTLFSFRDFWFVDLGLFWVFFGFFFSAYATWPLLFLFILSYKPGDIQSTPFEKKVVWMFVRDLLLTKQIDTTEIVSGWKSLCYMSPLSVETLRNFSEHSQQINWSRKMYCWRWKCALCQVFIWGAKQLRWCFFPRILLISRCAFGSSSLSCCLFPSPLLPVMFQQIWWLDPELTYGNAKPFVFTQGHSVCNRSFFPCFDTPAVKCTYSATVKVRDGCGWFMEVLVLVAANLWKDGYIMYF